MAQHAMAEQGGGISSATHPQPWHTHTHTHTLGMPHIVLDVTHEAVGLALIQVQRRVVSDEDVEALDGGICGKSARRMYALSNKQEAHSGLRGPASTR